MGPLENLIDSGQAPNLPNHIKQRLRVSELALHCIVNKIKKKNKSKLDIIFKFLPKDNSWLQ